MSSPPRSQDRAPIFVNRTSLPALQRAESATGGPPDEAEIRSAIPVLLDDFRGAGKGVIGALLYAALSFLGGFAVMSIWAAVQAARWGTVDDEAGDAIYWGAGALVVAAGVALWLLIALDRASARLARALVWWYDRLFEGDVRPLLRSRSTGRLAASGGTELVPPVAYSDGGRLAASVFLLCWGPLLAIMALAALVFPAGFGFLFIGAVLPCLILTFTSYARISRRYSAVTRASNPDSPARRGWNSAPLG